MSCDNAECDVSGSGSVENIPLEELIVPSARANANRHPLKAISSMGSLRTGNGPRVSASEPNRAPPVSIEGAEILSCSSSSSSTLSPRELPWASHHDQLGIDDSAKLLGTVFEDGADGGSSAGDVPVRVPDDACFDAGMDILFLKFKDKQLEQSYFEFQFVNSGFYGGKAWHVFTYPLLFSAYLFYHQGGINLDLVKGKNMWWSAHIIFFTNSLILLSIFVKRLRSYRELIFIFSLALHWPMWVVMSMYASGSRIIQWAFVLGCFMYCIFMAQIRFHRSVIVFTTMPLGTLLVSTFLTDYWEHHSHLEMLLWPVLFPCLLIIRQLELQQRNSFVTITRCTRRMANIRDQDSAARDMLSKFFPRVAVNAMVAPTASARRSSSLTSSAPPTPVHAMESSTGSMNSVCGSSIDHARVLSDTFIFVTDFAGFTEYAAGAPSREVIELLQLFYTQVDQCRVEYGVEKVSTVGDSFFGAIFLHDRPNPQDQVADGIDFALVLLSFQEKIKLRVGIHRGDVVGGFVGKSPPKFDLFGPSVEQCQLLEQEGTPGSIHVSETLLKVTQELNLGAPATGSATAGGTEFVTWNFGDTVIMPVRSFREEQLNSDDNINHHVVGRMSSNLATVERSRTEVRNLCDNLVRLQNPEDSLKQQRSVISMDTFLTPKNFIDEQARLSKYAFHPLFLYFYDAGIEADFKNSLRESKTPQKVMTILVSMLIYVCVIHSIWVCRTPLNFGLVALEFMCVIALLLYIRFFGVEERRTTMPIIFTLVNLGQLCAVLTTSKCSGNHTEQEVRTASIIMSYQPITMCMLQMYLYLDLRWRGMLGMLSMQLGWIFVAIQQYVLHEDALFWDWYWSIAWVANFALGYFAEYALRGGYSSSKLLHHLLQRSQQDYMDTAASVMSVMLPDFCAKELLSRLSSTALNGGGIPTILDDQTTIDVDWFEANSNVLWNHETVTVMFVHFKLHDVTLERIQDAIEAVEGTTKKFKEVQKIKTNGTTMLLAGGVRKEEKGDAPFKHHRMLDAAAAIMETLKSHHEIAKCKIGINSGPCFGAVIGVGGLCYDLFGDTVNFASRMQTTIKDDFGIKMSEATRVVLSMECAIGSSIFSMNTWQSFNSTRDTANNQDEETEAAKCPPMERETVFAKGKGDVVTYNIALP